MLFLICYFKMLFFFIRMYVIVCTAAYSRDSLDANTLLVRSGLSRDDISFLLYVQQLAWRLCLFIPPLIIEYLSGFPLLVSVFVLCGVNLPQRYGFLK